MFGPIFSSLLIRRPQNIAEILDEYRKCFSVVRSTSEEIAQLENPKVHMIKESKESIVEILSDTLGTICVLQHVLANEILSTLGRGYENSRWSEDRTTCGHSHGRGHGGGHWGARGCTGKMSITRQLSMINVLIEMWALQNELVCLINEIKQEAEDTGSL
nr:uncharacterized protein CTRU02_05450 [Colletotrichum truncatum]KAF6793893.1 hypothetical protein CTRU02_05450 [Colletotrichum truncatum]